MGTYHSTRGRTLSCSSKVAIRTGIAPTGVCLSRTSLAPSRSISARLPINRTLKSLKMCWECY